MKGTRDMIHNVVCFSKFIEIFCTSNYRQQKGMEWHCFKMAMFLFHERRRQNKGRWRHAHPTESSSHNPTPPASASFREQEHVCLSCTGRHQGVKPVFSAWLQHHGVVLPEYKQNKNNFQSSILYLAE